MSVYVEKGDIYDPYFITYDFEALQVPLKDEKLLDRNLDFEHVPATVSLCSNVPGHTKPIDHLFNVIICGANLCFFANAIKLEIYT